MYDKDKLIICGANSYEQKYYFNENFSMLPTAIKEELQIMCVLFTEDVGGILTVGYDEKGKLAFNVVVDEEDILFDEIGSELKIKELRRTKAELLESLEMFYEVFIKGKSE